MKVAVTLPEDRDGRSFCRRAGRKHLPNGA